MMLFDSQDIFDCQDIFNMVQIMLQVVNILDIFVAGGGYFQYHVAGGGPCCHG